MINKINSGLISFSDREFVQTLFDKYLYQNSSVLLINNKKDFKYNNNYSVFSSFNSFNLMVSKFVYKNHIKYVFLFNISLKQSFQYKLIKRFVDDGRAVILVDCDVKLSSFSSFLDQEQILESNIFINAEKIKLF